MRHDFLVCSVLIFGGCVAASGADPFADRVVDFSAGAGFNSFYPDPATALGSPERMTGEGDFRAVVSPFNPPYNPDQIVSFGAGGWLTLSFDEPVADDPLNAFGIDMILFTNGFLVDARYPDGYSVGRFGTTQSATVHVSSDGNSWLPAAFTSAVGAFPTSAYTDLTDPYSPTAGNTPSDFTRPVNPTAEVVNRSYSQVLAAYGGSGGGTGIDISPSGLPEISFVRIGLTRGVIQVDAISDAAPVPTPGAPLLLGCAGALQARRRRPLVPGALDTPRS